MDGHATTSAPPDASPLERFCGERAFHWLLAQTGLGVRAPGTPGHRAAQALITEVLGQQGLEVQGQRWQVPVSRAPGGHAELHNLWARVPGRRPGPSTLITTHYDTRWIADRDPDPGERERPIVGANDGGSGTAVQLELARLWTVRPPLHDVLLAFADGEDLGDLDGHAFASGSAHMVSAPDGPRPARVIALDMVGGRGMRLNLELNSLLANEASGRLFQELFVTGQGLGLSPFFGGQPRTVWSDHGPWLEAGVPAVLLIDIDYPQWHTQADTAEHCCSASLAAVGHALAVYLGGGAP